MIKTATQLQKALLVSAAIILSLSVQAELTIPNTFTAGTPAKAAEVNENFAAIVEAANAVQILKVHDNNGDLGQLLSIADFSR